MLFYTHLAFALLTALYLMPQQIFLVLLGSMIPDIDNVHSKINEKLKITKLFGYLFKHRGFCHSLWFALLLFITISYLAPNIAGPILVGYISHLIIDSITKQGIDYLAPIASFKVKGFIETGMAGEKMVLISIILTIALKLF